jgi:hypothetical protein
VTKIVQRPILGLWLGTVKNAVFGGFQKTRHSRELAEIEKRTAKYQAPKNRPKTQFLVTLISSSIMRVSLKHHESLLSQQFAALTFRPQIQGLINHQKVGLKDGL